MRILKHLRDKTHIVKVEEIILKLKAQPLLEEIALQAWNTCIEGYVELAFGVSDESVSQARAQESIIQYFAELTERYPQTVAQPL